jgi:hypothetical protein
MADDELSQNDLSAHYREKFWRFLEQEKDQIDRTLNKLLWIRGVPPELHQDFRHTIYEVCCSRMVYFDPALSGFGTWVVMWAKAVLRNYLRGNRQRNPVGERFFEVETDLIDPREASQESPVDKIGDPSLLFREELEDRIDLRRDILAYGERLKDYPLHSYVFRKLWDNGFAISDRQLEAMTGISRTTMGKVRREVMFELGLRIIGLGITHLGS